MTTADRPREGMTPMELVVAVLVAGVLAAVLAPVWIRAHPVSPTRVCMGNLQQLGAALTQYARDWDDSYPPNRFCKTPAPCVIQNGGLEGSSYNWKRALIAGGYLPSRQVWFCPANPWKWARSDANGCSGEESNCVGANKDQPDRQLPSGYAYNGSFFREDYGVRLMSDIADPAFLIMVVESKAGYPDLGDWAADSTFVHPGRRANWLFVDGKVQSLKLIETVRPAYLWRNPDDPTRVLTPADIPASLR